MRMALEGARRAGDEIIPLKDVPASRRVSECTDTWNDVFKAHWGLTPSTKDEIALLFEVLAPAGLLETSVLAYRAGIPIGVLYVVPEGTARAILKPGRVVQEAEKLNVLSIGVRESARGQGVNLAMAAYGYLELVRRGAQYLSYTLAYDDNWPSRRTAEKLGPLCVRITWCTGATSGGEDETMGGVIYGQPREPPPSLTTAWSGTLTAFAPLMPNVRRHRRGKKSEESAEGRVYNTSTV
jgi:predicted GNAT family acetyltransferase